jgi:hypothetical protein
VLHLFVVVTLGSHAMRKVPKTIYPTAEEIEEDLRERVAEADRLPDGPERQAILKEIAQLRMYAQSKRWIRSA